MCIKSCITLLITRGKLVETAWKTISLIHKIHNGNSGDWISTGLYNRKTKLFHRFPHEKDINLLTLHRKPKLWINNFNS